ncbi:MAG: efflux RND transporter periplasmic adaptor subunit [Steroidobacteraceae bacterium]
MAGSHDLRSGTHPPPLPARLAASVRMVSARKWAMSAVGLLLLLAGIRYFGDNGRSPAPSPARDPVAPVRVAKVERRNMAVVEQTLGTVVADATVNVQARVQGLLEAAYFQEGQFVKKGQLLFQIDPRPFQAALAQARATLAHDQALLKNATRDKLRYDELFKENSTSSQQHDTAAANVAALAATVALDKAAVDLARLNLGYTQVRSPINGKTGPLLVQPGNMISGTPGASLVTINQLQPIKLAFNLPQSDYWRILKRAGSDPPLATIDRSTAQGGTLSAPVDFTSNAVSGQSGTIELRASFANTNLSLLPGESFNVTVKLSEIHNALVIPRAALNYGPSGPYVFDVASGRAIMRSVTVRVDDGNNVAVAGDLKPGDAVILEGQLRVVPGGRVRVFAPVHIQMTPGDENQGPQYGPNGPSR